MTIERPMFPPRADDTIVQFPNSKKKTKRKSAVTDLPKSGFDLVRSKPPTKKGKAATPEQWAALEFEPWTKGDKEKELFGGENWHRHGVSVRFAYCLMLMSRKEMIDLHGEIDHEQMDDLFANIASAAEFLKSTVAMMEAVTLR
jgi:hypothetical protein